MKRKAVQDSEPSRVESWLCCRPLCTRRRYRCCHQAMRVSALRLSFQVGCKTNNAFG